MVVNGIRVTESLMQLCAYHPQNNGALSVSPCETSRKEDRVVFTSFILFRIKSAKIIASDTLIHRYP